ncbi:hypothetical protein EVAR_78313_1 [Eumeta japonica]|uniref:Uncharacterized protein n=1 Tax=Eumeta variegata TaxID=151549 RepID=A0A4C1T5T7_EUMVA|nr:hypothetical protein EVAR_78313_1 [Eumeta japonica]
MKAGKAVGYDRVSSEMLRGGGGTVASQLHQLFKNHRLIHVLDDVVGVVIKNTSRKTLTDQRHRLDTSGSNRVCGSRPRRYAATGPDALRVRGRTAISDQWPRCRPLTMSAQNAGPRRRPRPTSHCSGDKNGHGKRRARFRSSMYNARVQ